MKIKIKRDCIRSIQGDTQKQNLHKRANLLQLNLTSLPLLSLQMNLKVRKKFLRPVLNRNPFKAWRVIHLWKQLHCCGKGCTVTVWEKLLSINGKYILSADG